jgi:hypothetical protein
MDITFLTSMADNLAASLRSNIAGDFDALAARDDAKAEGYTLALTDVVLAGLVLAGSPEHKAVVKVRAMLWQAQEAYAEYARR